jgi:hypothetical protein
MYNDLASQWEDEANSRWSISITESWLRVIRIGALLCAAIGMAYFFDLLVAPPEHELALIKDKHTTCCKNGCKHVIHAYTRAWGGKDLEKDVAPDFYDRCLPGDVLRLTVTPHFKFWHSAALIHRGSAGNELTITDTRNTFILGFLFLIPALTWIPKVAATQARIFWIPVILCEAAAIISFAFKVFTGM